MNEETLASEWEDVTYEADESPEYDGDIYINEPGRVEIYYAPSDSSEVEEEETYIYLKDLEEPQENIVVESISEYSASTSRYRSVPDFKNVWKLTISNTEYSVLFPDGSDLVVVDGKIYNRGSNTVTGVVLDSSFSDSSYFQRTISILPLASSNTQNTVYRYGSRIYITTYSTPSQGYNLTTNVSYVQVSSVERPAGWQISQEGLVICGLLLFSVLVSIIGGLLRR